MTLNLRAKEKIVSEVTETANASVAVVGVHYAGMTVSELTAFRKEARENGVVVRVVRNTLARRALVSGSFASVCSFLEGPVLLVFSQKDPSSAAKLVKSFSKTNEFLKVHFLSLGGAALPASALDAVASLPTKEEAISRLIGVMRAPIQKYVSTLSGVLGKFVRTLDAVRDKKEQNGGPS